MGNKSKVMVFLFACCAGIMIIPFLASCGKSGNVSSAGSKILFQVANLSPDLQPVYLSMAGVRQTNTFSYPNPSGYFSLTNINTPITIRSVNTTLSTANLVTIKDTILKPNTRYTLFITGLRADSASAVNKVSGILVTDNAINPAIGRGKVRFFNASPRSTAFDVSANDTIAFRNIKYKAISDFVEMPAGNYNFKIMPTGLSTVISTLTNVTVLDGKVYTLYCRGVAGGADSVAFGSGIISNR